ncbi:MAG: biotin--[acetyl-CoA-carboxylase] ligase [Phycisphaera sp.]|nr:biotin--[acetyl-CoA-carboxylase] ligase [Phycisphaera sp.]
MAENIPICDVPLLDLLLRSDHPRSVHEIANSLGQSREQTCDAIQTLRALGCEFDDHPHVGLRLTRASLNTWRDYLEARHRSSHPTRWVMVYERTTSTQDALRRWAESHPQQAGHAVVVAREQTAGRGRLGRKWLSPRGPGSVLTWSYCVIDASDPTRAVWTLDRLMLCVSLAIASAVDELVYSNQVLAPHPVGIKWPNDLVVDGRKLAGILIESFTPVHCSTTRAYLIGIGLNIEDPGSIDGQNPIGLREMGCRLDPLLILSNLLDHLDRVITSPLDNATLTRHWHERNVLPNHTVELQSNGQTLRGQVIDVDPHEGLVVRTLDGAIVALPAAVTSVVRSSL